MQPLGQCDKTMTIFDTWVFPDMMPRRDMMLSVSDNWWIFPEASISVDRGIENELTSPPSQLNLTCLLLCLSIARQHAMHAELIFCYGISVCLSIQCLYVSKRTYTYRQSFWHSRTGIILVFFLSPPLLKKFQGEPLSEGR